MKFLSLISRSMWGGEYKKTFNIIIFVAGLHNYCINYAIIMHTRHDGIAGQGIISTLYFVNKRSWKIQFQERK